MRIAVTGASGQLGRSLSERSKQFPGIELIPLTRANLDLEDPGSVAAAISDVAPDVVINAAAYTEVDRAEDEPERAFQINADAAGEVAGAAARVGAAVIQISTDYVFDGRQAGPYDEDSSVNPLGVYGRSKLAGEERVRAANRRHAIIRTAWVYSPFGRNFVRSIIEAAAKHDKLRVVHDQRGSPTCALDFAEALLAMLEAGGGWGETYHLAGRGTASWCELAQEVMDQCAKLGMPNAPILPIPATAWPTRSARPSNSVLDSTKFEGRFGVEMPEWRVSVRTVLERLADRR